MNRDFTYCSGYCCPLADGCKRFNERVMKNVRNGLPYSFMSPVYDPERNECKLFVGKWV